MNKTIDEALKNMSLELSDGLSRKLRQQVTFYPVNHKEKQYDGVNKNGDCGISICRYGQIISILTIDRAVLSKLAALMFDVPTTSYNHSNPLSESEGFFQDYVNEAIKAVVAKTEDTLKEQYTVETLDDQHILYPSDTVDEYVFPVQVAGKKVGSFTLCVAEQ